MSADFLLVSDADGELVVADPNSVSLVAPDILLPIRVDRVNISAFRPEFQKFLSEYENVLREKIPTRVDNVIVSVGLYINVSANVSEELQDCDLMGISTHFRMYNVIDHSTCTFATDQHISILEIQSYAGRMHEYMSHRVDSYLIIDEIVKFAKGLSDEEDSL